MQAIAWLLGLLLLLLPTSTSAFHVPFHIPAPTDLPPSWGPGSSSAPSSCQALRQAEIQQCGPIVVPWFFIGGQPAMAMQYPIVPGQLLGDIWTAPIIVGPFHGQPPAWPAPNIAGSYVIWRCNPGIQIVQVRIPLQWDLIMELARKRNNRGQTERMSSDALPGFFQWLLTAPQLNICPTSALDLVQQTRDVIMGLSQRGQLDQLTTLFQAYVSTLPSTPKEQEVAP